MMVGVTPVASMMARRWAGWKFETPAEMPKFEMPAELPKFEMPAELPKFSLPEVSLPQIELEGADPLAQLDAFLEVSSTLVG